MSNLISIIDQGLIFSLVAIAVYMTSRVIKKDDLSVEGSFSIGGAITAVLMHSGFHVFIGIFLSVVLGALAGFFTGVLYARFKMNHLMAGLVTTTACFSISLGIASANLAVAEDKTMFRLIKTFSEMYAELLVLAAIAIVVLVMLQRFLRSEIGLLLKAVGDNPSILVHFAKSSERFYLIGFIIANAITALAGSLFVQWSGFFSITGNVGTLITGLASLMIAELITTSLCVSIVAAAIFYQSIFATTLMMGIDPVWNNMIKALIMVLLVVLSKNLPRIRVGRSHA